MELSCNHLLISPRQKAVKKNQQKKQKQKKKQKKNEVGFGAVSAPSPLHQRSRFEVTRHLCDTEPMDRNYLWVWCWVFQYSVSTYLITSKK